NNGNLIDGVTVVHDGGKFDDALSFNGVGGFVEVGHDPTMEPANVSVETWVKSTAPGANAYLLTKGAGGAAGTGSYSLNLNAGGNLLFSVFNGTAAQTSAAVPSA